MGMNDATEYAWSTLSFWWRVLAVVLIVVPVGVLGFGMIQATYYDEYDWLIGGVILYLAVVAAMMSLGFRMAMRELAKLKKEHDDLVGRRDRAGQGPETHSERDETDDA